MRIKRTLALFLAMVILFTGCGIVELGNPSSQENIKESESESIVDKETDAPTESEEFSETETQKDTSTEHESQPETESEPETETGTEEELVMYAIQPVNIRTEPNTSCEIFAVLDTNDAVIALGKPVEGWQRIRIEDKIVYVSSKYLSYEPVEEFETETEAETETETEAESECVLYAQASVHVRKKPTTGSESLGILKINDEVVALGEAADGWQKVRYKGKTGYVSSKYLKDTKVNTEIDWSKYPEEIIVLYPDNRERPLIVIDAGHQRVKNEEKEPIGPGSTTLKKKVSAGTKGCVTEWWEFELNLVIAMALKEELISRGYDVVMTRESHDVNISNFERAMLANQLAADAFIRIHANGDVDSTLNGAFTICQTPENPYNAHTYTVNRLLSESILNAYAQSTGCYKWEIMETDKMSGINWSMVPTTIIEMGHMTNPTEDALMATSEYQEKMVLGIANGIDVFFGKN